MDKENSYFSDEVFQSPFDDLRIFLPSDDEEAFYLGENSFSNDFPFDISNSVNLDLPNAYSNVIPSDLAIIDSNEVQSNLVVNDSKEVDHSHLGDFGSNELPLDSNVLPSPLSIVDSNKAHPPLVSSSTPRNSSEDEELSEKQQGSPKAPKKDLRRKYSDSELEEMEVTNPQMLMRILEDRISRAEKIIKRKRMNVVKLKEDFTQDVQSNLDSENSITDHESLNNRSLELDILPFNNGTSFFPNNNATPQEKDDQMCWSLNLGIQEQQRQQKQQTLSSTFSSTNASQVPKSKIFTLEEKMNMNYSVPHPLPWVGTSRVGALLGDVEFEHRMTGNSMINHESHNNIMKMFQSNKGTFVFPNKRTSGEINNVTGHMQMGIQRQQSKQLPPPLSAVSFTSTNTSELPNDNTNFMLEGIMNTDNYPAANLSSRAGTSKFGALLGDIEVQNKTIGSGGNQSPYWFTQ